MKAKHLIFLIVTLFLLQLDVILFMSKQKVKKPDIVPQPEVVEKKPELPPIKNSIEESHPEYLDYNQIVAQLKKWNKEAPEVSEVGTYGKSTKGTDLYYIRIANKRFIQTVERPKVLITACIHGNEPLATATTMWYIGSLLKEYNDNNKIRNLIDTRDIYFVPVVSPDSYPNSRYVDGVDPNRNFPKGPDSTHQSIQPIAALQDFFNTIKPQAAISGHTWGRVYLTPYGDSMENCPDHEEFNNVVGKMAELSGYRKIRACDMYRGNGKLNNPPIRTLGEDTEEYKVLEPIYGTEVDWYYRNRLFSHDQGKEFPKRGCFALICEYGTHQRIPSKKEIEEEFNMTWEAFVYFLQEAPLVEIWWDESGNGVHSDGSPKKN